MTVTGQILEIASQFEKLGYEFAFLGGAVLQVLLTDQAAEPVRVTKDIDVLVSVTSLRKISESGFCVATSRIRSKAFSSQRMNLANAVKCFFSDSNALQIWLSSGRN